MKTVSARSKRELSSLFWILAGLIFFVGIFFRFYQLSTDELIFDEGIYAFRSIGYLDYLENPAQITPIQKYVTEEMPSWLYLSFHDHPPLFFFIEHIFFNVLGVTVFVSRLPSALAGVISLFLIFFITRKLFEKSSIEKLREWKNWAGLFSSSIMAVSFASVSVARLNQLEGVLFCLILLNIYLFLKLIDDPKWWWMFGISFGLCILTKYTAVFLVPTYFVYLFITRSLLLKNWRWYGGFALALVIFSPVIIYNIYLYKTFGHFDLQLAYLFKQATPEWGGVGGKNQEPFSNIFSNLNILCSIPFYVLSLVGLIYVTLQKNLGKARFFVPLIFIFVLLLLVAVGSALRFIATLLIPTIILIVYLFFLLAERFGRPKIFMALAILFLIYEAYFSANLIFLQKADYGIQKLDAYFQSILGEARLPGLLNNPNFNLNKVIEEYAKNRPSTLPLIGIIYDDEISNPARLWLFSRRQYYQGIPVMPASQFLKILRDGGGAMFKGFQIYMVKAMPATTISPVNDQLYIDSLEAFFLKLPAQTKLEIKGTGGLPAFEVAHFGL